MKHKDSRNSPGFTLIELLLALSLVSVVIAISANLLFFGTRTQKSTIKEYSMQSDIRRATEMTNELIRYSKAVFAVPQTFVESTDKMDPGWNYLMVTSDSKKIVRMEYDSTLAKHVEKVVVQESEDIRYHIEFEKDEAAKSDNIIKYKIYAYNTDKNGNKIKQKVLFETTIEAINAVQIVDKGTDTSPSVALAFRSDGQTSGKGKNQMAYITLIVDTSNSMNAAPNGAGATNDETSNSRIRKVREALIGDGTSKGNGIIQQLAKEENVFISFVPFAETANYPSPFANTKPNASHPIHEVFLEKESNELITTVKGTAANGHENNLGGTNTGDGLRRAYHLHNNFRNRMDKKGVVIKDKDQVHHYTILLIDGKSTYDTKQREWKDDGGFQDKDIFRWEWSGWWWEKVRIGQYKVWVPKGKSQDSFFLSDGNIDVEKNKKAISPYRPISVPDSPIKNAEYGGKFDPITDKFINGTGEEEYRNLANIGVKYIEALGSQIKNFDSGNGIKSYIIGYAENLEPQISAIGNEIGTESENIYKYNDPSFDLNEILKNIATDIMADFWLAAGPQIMD